MSAVELAGVGTRGRAEGKSPVIDNRKKVGKSQEVPVSCVRRVCDEGSEWKHGRLQGVMFAGPGRKPQPAPQDVSRGWRAERADSGQCV